MRVLLVDCDSVIPNLALMRISTYHKSINNSVELVRLHIPVYGKKCDMKTVDCTGYDFVYVSAIFSSTPRRVMVLSSNENCIVDYGGTGYDITKKLPPEIESCKPDYSIYTDNDTSYGFISRGCFRNCKFCVVPQKEGELHPVVKSVAEIIEHKKVNYLDTNFLGLINCKHYLQELIALQIPCQFNQGLDIRVITDELAELLSQLNYIGEYIFAFDDIRDKELIESKLKIAKKYIPKDWNIKFFVYCHPQMDIAADVYSRILWCKENKVLPYFMRDLSCWESESARTYNDFSAWCNQPGIFKTHAYEQFCKKRRPHTDRADVLPEWYVNYERTKNGHLVVETMGWK